MSFVEKITPEEYERQARDYTKQMLEDLSNTVRRNPNTADSTAHFKQKYSQVRCRELLLKTGLFIIVGGPLWFAFSECDFSKDNLLSTLRKEVLCSLGMSMTTIPPFLLLTVAGITFSLWILAMHLQSKQVQLKITSFQQIALVLINNFILPSFLSIMTTLFLFFMATIKFNKKTSACVNGTDQLVDWFYSTNGGNSTSQEDMLVASLSSILSGAAKMGGCIGNMFSMDEPSSLFMAFTGCVFFCLYVLRTLVSISSVHSSVRVICIAFMAIAIQLLNIGSNTRKGEQFIMSLWIVELIVTVTEMIALLLKAWKAKKSALAQVTSTSDSIIEEEDEEDEEGEESTQ